MRRQTIITFIVLAAAAFIGWAWFSYVRAPAGGEAAPISSPESEDRELAQYRQLNSLKPDTEILSNTIFKSLESANQEVSVGEIAKGRPDPFLPLSGSSPAPTASPPRPRTRPAPPSGESGSLPAPLAPTAPGL